MIRRFPRTLARFGCLFRFSIVCCSLALLILAGETTQAADQTTGDLARVFRLHRPSSGNSAIARIFEQANAGDIRAQARLGYMYQTGNGVPQHYGQAMTWYERAANSGDGNAQFGLGLLYDRGLGVPIDVISAYVWLSLSAAQADRSTRDFKVRIRNAVASKMSAAQIVLAQQLTLNWPETRRSR